jgi:DNA helicase-4
LSHISEKKYYGITVLVDVLKGSQSKKIKEAHLDEIPEYAVLQAVNREDLTSMVEWLIDNHFILQTKGAYPVLHPTYDGIHYDETITSGKLKKLLEYLQAKE